MKNVISIFIFFTIKTFILFGQTEADQYTIQINDTSNTVLNPIYFKLIKKGYLIPTFKILKNDNHFLLEIHRGPKYSKIHIQERNHKTSVYSPFELSTSMENQFKQLLNNGFPFSTIKIDSINFKNQDITGKISIQKGLYFQWGDLHIKGNATINEQILRGILDLKKDDPYNEETFQNISQKINQLPYLSMFQSPELLFENNKVDVYLYLNSKPINTISGTVGLQQNPKTQNYFLIGDLKIKLINQLKRSEGFDLQWRRIQESTQSLKIGFNYPSLLKSNFGIDNQFNLYKKDSTFIELKNQFGIQYFSTKGNTIKINYKYIESGILSIANKNPLLGKSINYFYGGSLSKQKIDYLPAPRKGFQFLIDISLGKRVTSRTDSLKNKFDNTLRAEYQIIKYLSFLKRHILKTQATGEIYLAPYYYQNELIRFGGLLNQRGFREDELLGNMRFTQTIEYRFMLEQNSFIFSYFDISYFENHVKKPIYSTPYGFGTGMSFGTQQGIFSISYALGKQFNNPILLKNGIVHFGYISYF